MMDNQDKAAPAAISTATAGPLTLGSITVAVAKSTFLGLTVSTTTVALPVAGLVVGGGALTYGGYRVWRAMRGASPSLPGDTGSNDPPAPESGTSETEPDS